MFRRERPQHGRFRQFHQFGVELFGPAHPLLDVEMMALGHTILAQLGVRDLVRYRPRGDKGEGLGPPA